MNATGLRSFDRTVHATNVWLDEVMRELEWDDRERAYQALRVVLHALRDHLPLNESAQLAAQLPQLIRGLYYEGWNPSHTRAKERHWDEFILPVADAFSLDPNANPSRIAQVVLKVLARHVSSGEVSDVKHCLPEEIRRYWIADWT